MASSHPGRQVRGIINTKTVIGVALVVVSVILGWMLAGQRPAGETSAADVTLKTVHYRFRIWNSRNQPIADAYLLVYAPLETTGFQRRMSIEASHPYELSAADPLGNQLLKFSFDAFPPYASKIVSIRSNLMLAATPAAVSEKELDGSVVLVPDLEADWASVRQLARGLESENVYDTAGRIYRWVADHIVYNGYSGKEKGARFALSGRQGDCTEFADLFVALTRAVNIPARRVSGYLVNQDCVLTPTDSHDWAEFYENGVWRIADPQRRNFDSRYRDYIAIRIDYTSAPSAAPGGFQRFYIHGKGLKAALDS